MDFSMAFFHGFSDVLFRLSRCHGRLNLEALCAASFWCRDSTYVLRNTLVDWLLYGIMLASD